MRMLNRMQEHVYRLHGGQNKDENTEQNVQRSDQSQHVQFATFRILWIGGLLMRNDSHQAHSGQDEHEQYGHGAQQTDDRTNVRRHHRNDQSRHEPDKGQKARTPNTVVRPDCRPVLQLIDDRFTGAKPNDRISDERFEGKANDSGRNQRFACIVIANQIDAQMRTTESGDSGVRHECVGERTHGTRHQDSGQGLSAACSTSHLGVSGHPIDVTLQHGQGREEVSKQGQSRTVRTDLPDN
jgi:hypothetical protein